jgi:hypothetical protein
MISGVTLIGGVALSWISDLSPTQMTTQICWLVLDIVSFLAVLMMYMSLRTMNPASWSAYISKYYKTLATPIPTAIFIFAMSLRSAGYVNNNMYICVIA